ncbi:MAG: guanylate kinase [Arenicellaceae bacterium]|nr:guanylate kinase [Arenicellaceae bacterium]
MTESAAQLLILSAPSGAGKTSLARALVEQLANTVMSISHTTREQRDGEKEGLDYYFVDDDKFAKMVESGGFLEHAEVYSYRYGTGKQAVQKQLERGNNVLLDIDWQGGQQIRSVLPDVLSVSILPPSVEELEQRLRSRAQDSEETIQRRMSLALAEMRHCYEADFIVLNDDFESALDDLKKILQSQPEQIRPLMIDLQALLK